MRQLDVELLVPLDLRVQSLLEMRFGRLDRKYQSACRWQGKTYLPGEEVEIPDDLAKAIGVEKKEEEKQKEEEEKEETPSPTTRSRTKA